MITYLLIWEQTFFEIPVPVAISTSAGRFPCLTSAWTTAWGSSEGPIRSLEICTTLSGRKSPVEYYNVWVLHWFFGLSLWCLFLPHLKWTRSSESASPTKVGDWEQGEGKEIGVVVEELADLMAEDCVKTLIKDLKEIFCPRVHVDTPSRKTQETCSYEGSCLLGYILADSADFLPVRGIHTLQEIIPWKEGKGIPSWDTDCSGWR